jgi:hypothetical protein
MSTQSRIDAAVTAEYVRELARHPAPTRAAGPRDDHERRRALARPLVARRHGAARLRSPRAADEYLGALS